MDSKGCFRGMGVASLAVLERSLNGVPEAGVSYGLNEDISC